MSRLEFPSDPLYKRKETTTSLFQMDTLEGADIDLGPEIELGHCVVTSSPVYHKRVKKPNEWLCTIRVHPDFTHPDQEGEYIARAGGEKADLAHSCHLRAGDSAMMVGRPYTQETELGSGETAIVTYFGVSSVEVISRSPRISVTAYEKHQGS